MIFRDIIDNFSDKAGKYIFASIHLNIICFDYLIYIYNHNVRSDLEMGSLGYFILIKTPTLPW